MTLGKTSNEPCFHSVRLKSSLRSTRAMYYLLLIMFLLLLQYAHLLMLGLILQGVLP